MTGDVEVPGPGRYPWAVRVAAGIVAILGLAVLAGWILERPALARLGSREVPVAPSTAFLFVLFAGAILLRMRAAAAPRAVPGATIAGGALALTLLLLSSLGIHLDVEHPWIAIGHALGSPPLAHMSPVTAGCFVVVALSLLVGVRGRRPWVLKAGRWGAGVVTGIGLVLGLGYLYGTPFLYRGAFIPPAFLTSVGFLVLGAALLGVLAPPAGPPAEVHARSARLLIGIFAVLAAGTVGAGFLLQRSFEARYRAEVEQELLAIADLKTRELETWRAERVADAAMFLDNPAFNALAGRVFADGADEAAGHHRRQLPGTRSAAGPRPAVSVCQRGVCAALRPPAGERRRSWTARGHRSGGICPGATLLGPGLGRGARRLRERSHRRLRRPAPHAGDAGPGPGGR